MTAGTIIGARLGHVFFYEWPRYREHWVDIFKVWEGGLASHGGTLGVLIALWLFHFTTKRYLPFSLLNWIDIVSIPTAFVGCCIRIGNFINQEILGTQTTLPWGVIFGNPADGSVPEPRHPVQLYESLTYFATFIFLLILWKKYHALKRPGLVSGLFFIIVFGSRFIFEVWKQPMSLMLDESFIQTGQLLSIPFILLGVGLSAFGPKLSRER